MMESSTSYSRRLRIYCGALLTCLLAISSRLDVVSTEKSYDIHMDKLVQVYVDDSFGDFSNVKVVKYNRTTAVVNGTFDLFIDPNENILATVEGYEKVGTEYTLSAIQLKDSNLCDLLEEYGESFRLPRYNVSTNFIFKCPFRKGSYYVENFIPDEESLPEDVPGRFWRFDVKLRNPEDPTKELVFVQAYMQVERKVQSRKVGM